MTENTSTSNESGTGKPGAASAGTPSGTGAAPPAASSSVPSVTSENRVPQSVVDRVTGEKWDAIRRAEESERKLALAQATIDELGKIAKGDTSADNTTRSAAPDAKRALSADELRALVTQEAELQRFNAECNTAVETGRKAHTDFDKVVLQDLTRLSPVYDPRSGGPILPRPLVEAALETGAPGDVLYELGRDPTNAERIMRLPPIRQAVEIARFHERLLAARSKNDADADDADGDNGGDAGTGDDAAASASARAPLTPENTSRAPAPIRAAAGRRATGSTRSAFDILDTSKSDTKEWIAQREADLARKRQNGASRR